MDKFKKEKYQFYITYGTSIKEIVSLLQKEDQDDFVDSDQYIDFSYKVPLTEEEYIKELQKEIESIQTSYNFFEEQQRDKLERIRLKKERLNKLTSNENNR